MDFAKILAAIVAFLAIIVAAIGFVGCFVALSILIWTFVSWKIWGWYAPLVHEAIPILTFSQILCVKILYRAITGTKFESAMYKHYEAKHKHEDEWNSAQVSSLGTLFITPFIF